MMYIRIIFGAHVSLLPRIEMHADQTVDFARLSRNLSCSLRCSFWVHVKNASRALKSKSLKNNLNGDPALAAIVLCIYINNIYKYILVDWEKERKRGSLAHRERKKEKKKGKKKKEGKADEQEAGRNTKWRHDVPCLLNRSSSLSLCTVPYTLLCLCSCTFFRWISLLYSWICSFPPSSLPCSPPTKSDHTLGSYTRTSSSFPYRSISLLLPCIFFWFFLFLQTRIAQCIFFFVFFTCLHWVVILKKKTTKKWDKVDDIVNDRR